MTYNEVYDAMIAIKETQGTNAKIEKAKEYSDSTYFSTFVYFTYAQAINFWIKKIPIPKDVTTLPEKYLSNVGFIELLLDLAGRKISGNSALDIVATYRHYLISNEEHKTDKLFVMILNRDLRTGIAVKGWNKVFGYELLPQVQCMKAREMNDKNLANIKYPAWAQTKFDGTRLIYNFNKGKGILQSRNGSQFSFLNELKNELDKKFKLKNKVMIDGEIVFYDTMTGMIFDRKTSNGYATKCIKGVTNFPFNVAPLYVVWDIVIDDETTVPYQQRYNDLFKYDFDNKELTKIAEAKVVNNIDEARDVYMQELSRGEEGIILKNVDAPWTNNRSKHLVKFKEVIEVDLRAVEFNYGKERSKYEKTLGYITFSSDDGSILVNVGSGFSDANRDYIIENWENEFKGKVATIKCNAFIDDKNGRESKSLFLPTFGEWRYDKDETNSAGDF